MHNGCSQASGLLRAAATLVALAWPSQQPPGSLVQHAPHSVLVVAAAAAASLYYAAGPDGEWVLDAEVGMQQRRTTLRSRMRHKWPPETSLTQCHNVRVLKLCRCFASCVTCLQCAGPSGTCCPSAVRTHVRCATASSRRPAPSWCLHPWRSHAPWQPRHCQRCAGEQ
jgi:hypothetical protein